MLRGLLVLLCVSIGVYADHAPYDRSPVFENGTLGPWPTEAYRSAPVIGPALNQLQYDPRCRDGRSTLLAPRGSSVRSPGPMILDQDGHLTWTRNYGLTGKNTYNVNVYPFRDQAYLTFWVGDDRSGKGEYYMVGAQFGWLFALNFSDRMDGEHERGEYWLIDNSSIPPTSKNTESVAPTTSPRIETSSKLPPTEPPFSRSSMYTSCLNLAGSATGPFRRSRSLLGLYASNGAHRNTSNRSVPATTRRPQRVRWIPTT